MKQIPKYEYFLIRATRYAEYMSEVVTEITNTIATMAKDGWQVEGNHHMIITGNNYQSVHMTQMMKRFHPDYLEHAQALTKEMTALGIETITSDVIVVE
jgi:hypothetical protein